MSKILSNRIRPAEYDRVVWAATPEAGTVLKDVQEPSYWSHVAKNLKPGAQIEVTAADGSWFARLYVRSADDNSAKVFTLDYWNFDLSDEVEKVATDKAPTDKEPEFVVKHRGPKGWCVSRSIDNMLVFENGATRSDADQWVANQSLS